MTQSTAKPEQFDDGNDAQADAKTQSATDAREIIDPGLLRLAVECHHRRGVEEHVENGDVLLVGVVLPRDPLKEVVEKVRLFDRSFARRHVGEELRHFACRVDVVVDHLTSPDFRLDNVLVEDGAELRHFDVSLVATSKRLGRHRLAENDALAVGQTI